MAFRFGELNPLSWLEVDNRYASVVDFIDVFPNGNNLSIHDYSYHGMRTPRICPTFSKSTITGQVQSSVALTSEEVSFTALSCFGTQIPLDFSWIDITPTPWSAGGSYLQYIYFFDITLLEDEQNAIELRFTDGTEYWKTEPFFVREKLPNHVKIEYSTYRNKHGMITELGSNENLYHTVFVDARITRNSGSTKSVFENNSIGNKVVTQSVLRKGWNINIPKVVEYFSEKLGFIFGCDLVRVNGIFVVSDADLEIDPLVDEFVGLFSGKITVTQSTFDGRNNVTTVPQIVLADSDSAVLEDDWDEVVLSN